MSDLFVDRDLDDLASQIDGWLAELVDTSEGMVEVERATVDNIVGGDPLWLVRLAGEAKNPITIWLVLRQRTLSFDHFLLPQPPAVSAALLEFLLRRNAGLVGVYYAIADPDAIHLRSSLPDRAVTQGELDRVIGTMYDTIERDFAHVVFLAFGTADTT